MAALKREHNSGHWRRPTHSLALDDGSGEKGHDSTPRERTVQNVVWSSNFTGLACFCTLDAMQREEKRPQQRNLFMCCTIYWVRSVHKLDTCSFHLSLRPIDRTHLLEALNQIFNLLFPRSELIHIFSMVLILSPKIQVLLRIHMTQACAHTN